MKRCQGMAVVAMWQLPKETQLSVPISAYQSLTGPTPAPRKVELFGRWLQPTPGDGPVNANS